MDEQSMDEDSSCSSVDDIVTNIKLQYPNAVVNVEVIETNNGPKQQKSCLEPNTLPASSNTYCESLNFNNFDGLINYCSESDNPVAKPSCSNTSVNIVHKNTSVNSVIKNVFGLFSDHDQDDVDNLCGPNAKPSCSYTSVNSLNKNIISGDGDLDNVDDSDTNVDDPDWTPPTSTETNNQEEGEIEVQDISLGREKKERKRKMHSDPSQWNDGKNKKLREQGKSYKGWERPKDGKGKRGHERDERKLGPPCKSEACKKSKFRQCQGIEMNERDEIFSNFWEKLSWDQKKMYIVSLVTKAEKKHTTKKPGELSRKNFSYSYNLKKLNGTTVPVCKTMFLNTFGLKEWSVQDWVSKAKPFGMTPSQETVNKERRNTRPTRNTNEAKQMLMTFLDMLPKLPSHYCRKSTTKVYVEPTGGNMTDIYNEYKKMCETNEGGPIQPLSRFTFDTVVNSKNIAFQPPKKDRCDTCISYEVGQVKESVYNEHIANKEAARAEKEKDKKMGEEGKCIVITQDLQSVKVCPSLNASALYYKTKLICHNFTMFDINKHTARCFWFDETQADLTASTFASCVTDFLSDICVNTTPIILWSDGCTAQNRNAVFANALLSFSYENNVIITQKFLEKGHTQMEVDSVHATIERKLKNKHIYLPSDYIRYSQEARQNPDRYATTSVTFEMIRDFSAKGLMVFESIRPGKKPGDPTVTDIRQIKYLPSGKIQYKLSFHDEEFKDLPQRRKLENPANLSSFCKLHKKKLKITETKWRHLQELKVVIPTDCHHFYDSLEYHQDQPSVSTSSSRRRQK